MLLSIYGFGGLQVSIYTIQHDTADDVIIKNPLGCVRVQLQSYFNRNMKIKFLAH